MQPDNSWKSNVTRHLVIQTGSSNLVVCMPCLWSDVRSLYWRSRQCIASGENITGKDSSTEILSMYRQIHYCRY